MNQRLFVLTIWVLVSACSSQPRRTLEETEQECRRSIAVHPIGPCPFQREFAPPEGCDSDVPYPAESWQLLSRPPANSRELVRAAEVGWYQRIRPQLWFFADEATAVLCEPHETPVVVFIVRRISDRWYLDNIQALRPEVEDIKPSIETEVEYPPANVVTR